MEEKNIDELIGKIQTDELMFKHVLAAVSNTVESYLMRVSESEHEKSKDIVLTTLKSFLENLLFNYYGPEKIPPKKVSDNIVAWALGQAEILKKREFKGFIVELPDHKTIIAPYGFEESEKE